MPTKTESTKKKKAIRHKKRQASQGKAKEAYKNRMLNKIKKYDDKWLSVVCADTTDLDKIAKIAKTLRAILCFTESGVGLAAPQIGHGVNMFVIRPDPSKNVFKTFVNPVVFATGDKILSDEGCLSYPDTYTKVQRSSTVSVVYFDENLEKQESTYDELSARIIQHEADHLKGICKVGDWYRNIEAFKNR